MISFGCSHHLSDDFGAIIERWRSKHYKSELPTISELSTIVDRPLPDNEKIPITIDRMNDLVSLIDAHDICTSDDVALLFRAGYGDTILDRYFFAVAEAPPAGGTYKSFYSFWDKNIRDILELLVPGGKSIRNGNQRTATMNMRPDYAFVVNKLCAFRGEERAPESRDDPSKELRDKLAWGMSLHLNAWYIDDDNVRISSLIATLTGYYAIGPDFTLVAISQHLVVHDIAHANLRC
jgi:hypothetical protein